MNLPKWWYQFMDSLTFFDTKPENVYPLISITYGCGTKDKPNWRNLIIGWGRDRCDSLYYNAPFYLRIMVAKHWIPVYVGLMIRWSGSTTKRAYVQTHFGPRLSGKMAITLRFPTDETDVISNTGDPTRNNYGHAVGWECGHK